MRDYLIDKSYHGLPGPSSYSENYNCMSVVLYYSIEARRHFEQGMLSDPHLFFLGKKGMKDERGNILRKYLHKKINALSVRIR